MALGRPQCPRSDTGRCAPCPSFSVGRCHSDTHTFTVTVSTCHLIPRARSFRPQRSLWCSELMRRVLGPKTSPGSPAGLPRCGPSVPGFLGASLAPTLEMGPGLLSLALAALSRPVFSPKSPVLTVEATSSTLAGHRSIKLPSVRCITRRAHCKIKMKTLIQKSLGIARQQTKQSIELYGGPK